MAPKPKTKNVKLTEVTWPKASDKPENPGETIHAGGMAWSPGTTYKVGPVELAQLKDYDAALAARQKANPGVEIQRFKFGKEGAAGSVAVLDEDAELAAREERAAAE